MSGTHELATAIDTKLSYDLMVDTIPRLGWDLRQLPELPSVGAVEELLTSFEGLGELLKSRAESGAQDHLIMVPRVGGDGIGIAKLIQMSTASPKSHAWKQVWGDGSGNVLGRTGLQNKDPLHDNVDPRHMSDGGAWVAAIVLGTKREVTLADKYSSSGGADTPPRAQRRLAAHTAEAIEFKRIGVPVTTANAAEALATIALGPNLIDTPPRIVLLPHYPQVYVNGRWVTRAVYGNPGAIDFQGLGLVEQNDNIGPIRVVQLGA